MQIVFITEATLPTEKKETDSFIFVDEMVR